MSDKINDAEGYIPVTPEYNRSVSCALKNTLDYFLEEYTVCDKNRDSATSNQLQDILDKTERRKWFLYEVMQGSKNTE